MNGIGIQMRLTQKDVDEKRQQVRWAYAVGYYYDQWEPYNFLFDELHDLTMLFMAQKFRDEHGLSEHAKTPYC